jgi:hypothetical protein
MKCKFIKRFDYFDETYWFIKITEIFYQPWEGLTLYVGPSSVHPHEYQKDEIKEIFVRELDDCITCRMKTFRCGEGMGNLESWVKHFRDHGWKLIDSQYVDPHSMDFTTKIMSLPREKTAKKVPAKKATPKKAAKKKALPKRYRRIK